MKKIVLLGAILIAMSSFVFAKECGKCGTEYYGDKCPYCKGYSLGIKDKYNDTNSSKNCDSGDYTNDNSTYARKQQQKTEGRANCYEGYDDAQTGKAPKTSN